MTISVTVAKGDGIGPSIMDSVLKIFDAAKVDLKYDFITVGEEQYKAGHTSGIAPEDWQTIRNNPVFLKAPITTPQGGGYKSLNVTIRKTLQLYSNVRPSKAFAPYVKCFYPELDLVVVRENEEDLYIGSEYRLTEQAFQSLKILTKAGSERIIRHAFEYAKKSGRKKVTCMTKNNIMKISDGMFAKVFEEVAKEYPEINSDHYIIDIGSARIAARPQDFDVIVTLNLYGDVISDIASEVSGSVGLAGSSNIGDNYAMFEAIHGSAPAIAGKNKANPAGLLNGAIMMLSHLGMGSKAQLIEKALLKTLEDGVATADIYNEEVSTKLVGTEQFTDEIIARLGQEPTKFKAGDYQDFEFKWDNAKKSTFNTKFEVIPSGNKTLSGVDVFIDKETTNSKIGEEISKIKTDKLSLSLVSYKGLKVYPEHRGDEITADFWICRFKGEAVTNGDIVELLNKISNSGYDFVKVENLYNFDGSESFSKAQGE